MIECVDFNHAYIRKTIDSLKLDIRNIQIQRVLYTVLVDKSHHSNINNLEIVNFNMKGEKLELLEVFEIKKNSLVSPSQINILYPPLF